MSERCHCTHNVSKRACQHKGFCERIEELEAELAKHQGSTFHPDWSLLEATRDTVEELKRELKIANIFAVSRRKVIAELQTEVEELEARLKAEEGKAAKLIEALRYLSDDGWFDEESTTWEEERDSRINFAASFLPTKEKVSDV